MMRRGLWWMTGWLLVIAGGLPAPSVPQETDETLVLQLVELGDEIPEEDEGWFVALVADRASRDEMFRTSPTSPMAGTQYLKSDPNLDEVVLTREGRVFALARGEAPGAVLRVRREGGSWRWLAEEPGVSCRVGPEEQPSGSVLDEMAVFTVGEMSLSFVPDQSRVTFIVFDPQRPELAAFEHLLYYPPTSAFRLPARLERLAEPAGVTMLTSRNLEKTFYRYATIHFQLDGGSHRLTAFKYELAGPESRVLFIPFRDGTSGEETYGGGRYLILDEPEGEEFDLDFNRAFNPLCNYSPAFNCAVPPRENHLTVAIRAGEKTYPH